jgi:hypothetical protein
MAVPGATIAHLAILSVNMKRFARCVFPFLLLLRLGSACAAQDEAAGCGGDLEALSRFMPGNDAGASAELADHGMAIEEALRKARINANQVTGAAACDLVLATYLRSWRPGHLMVMSQQSLATFTAGPTEEKGGQKPADPRAPVFRVLDKDTVLLEFGTFFPGYQSSVEALLATHRVELESHKNWIIDVRNNNGGSDATYAPLLPWLTDMGSVVHGVEWLASPANARSQVDLCAMQSGINNCAEIVAPIVRAMSDAKTGTWVTTDTARIGYQRSPTPGMRQPKRVAVLVDQPCGSSCEQFVLTVRQNFRVKLVGRPTAGQLDYSNLRPYHLPSGRILLYATSRSIRLPLMPVDNVGVQPDVLLPVPADAAGREAEVRQVQRWLAGGSLRPQ